MTRTKIAAVAVWVVSGLLTMAFVLAGMPKVLQAPVWVDKFDAWGYSKSFLMVIGVVEITGAVLLLIPRLAVLGVGVLAAVMLGAGYTHLANAEGLEVARPLIFLGLLAIVGWARRPRNGQSGHGHPRNS